MFSMYIVLLKCNHLEVIFFDTMDRNNVLLRRQIILNLCRILNIYLMLKLPSFVLQEISVLVESLLDSYGIEEEMPNSYALS